MAALEPKGAFPPVRLAWPAFLMGVGLMAAVDEVIFHQVLGWHHFYDRSTPAIGLLSDGLLHAAELLALVAGFFGFLSLCKRGLLIPVWMWSAFFVGAGLFQVFDGIINHKLLRLHQVRYGVDLLPYDIAWNGFGALLILIGVLLAFRSKRSWQKWQDSACGEPWGSA